MRSQFNRRLLWRFCFISFSVLVACLLLGTMVSRFVIESQVSGPHRPIEMIGLQIQDLSKETKLPIEKTAFLVTRSFNERSPQFIKVVDTTKDTSLLKSKERLENAFALDERFWLESSFPGPGLPPAPKIILGMGALMIAIVLLGLGSTYFLFHSWLLRTAKEAEQIMAELMSGKLSARFSSPKSDEIGGLMRSFNLMAQEIEGLVQRLRQAESTKSLLLQELAHDLRTPLASLKNMIELLIGSGEKLGPAKREEFLELAYKEILYYEDLVENLLFISGVNDPKYSSPMKRVQLDSLLSDEISLHQGHHLHWAISTRPVSILGDDVLLRRLLKNVCSNVARYGGTRARVSMVENKDCVTLTFEDNGPGLGKTGLEQFGEKKFSRSLVDGKHISIGLGSVIIKKITTLYSGELNVTDGNDPAYPGLKLTLVFPVIR